MSSDTPATSRTTDLRCSTQTAELAESPNGSAGTALRYILVELPLPWPKPISVHPLLAFLGETPTLTPDYRVLAIHGPDTVAGQHRLISYDQDPNRRPHFLGRQMSAPTSGLEPAIRDLLDGSVMGDLLDPTVADVAICTQGSHDRCCGLLGTELYLSLLVDPPANARLWRTSHTGGHRFAPTAAIFPSGQMWATLTRSNLDAVLSHDLPAAEAAAILRGSMGLATREAQVADAAAFAQLGWPWIETSRHVAHQARNQTSTEVVLQTRDGTKTVTVVMNDAPALPIPKCGEPLDAATKATSTFEVISLKAATAGTNRRGGCC